jgi:hypothetical protein
MLASSLLVVNSSLWLADGEPPPRGAIDATIQVATPTVSAATETLEAVR